MTRRWLTIGMAVAAATSGALAAEREVVPVTDAMLSNPDPDDWLMWRRTQDSWGYSPLDEIDRDSVARLTLAWSVELDEARRRKAFRSSTTV